MVPVSKIFETNEFLPQPNSTNNQKHVNDIRNEDRCDWKRR